MLLRTLHDGQAKASQGVKASHFVYISVWHPQVYSTMENLVLA